MINVIDKYEPREYSAFSTNSGVVLCDKDEGSFIVLRYPSDVKRLIDLLKQIKIIESGKT